MGVSAIEWIYLPNLLYARGIKPTKSQKSEENWVFKLARSTYAQADKISPRTAPVREPRCFPRIPALPTAEQSRCFPQALPLHTRIIPLNPASSNLLPDTFCLFQS